jgi:hypothetical protein
MQTFLFSFNFGVTIMSVCVNECVCVCECDCLCVWGSVGYRGVVLKSWTGRVLNWIQAIWEKFCQYGAIL